MVQEIFVHMQKKNNVRFIYISTDYVFDGNKGNYSENDKPNPRSTYGKSKLSAENIVKTLNNYLIIRTSFFSKTTWTPPLSLKEFLKCPAPLPPA